MANTTTITTPQKGMVLDLHSSNQQEGMYVYALNATLEQNTEDAYVIQNDSSNFLTVKFPEGSIVIGHKLIVEQDRIIFFLIGKNNIYEIGEIVYTYNKYDTRPSSKTRKSFCTNCTSVDLIEPTPLENTAQIPASTYKTIIQSDCFNFNRLHSIDIEYKITDCTLELYFIDGYNKDRYIYFDYDVNTQNLTVQKQFFTNNVLDCTKLIIQPSINRPIIQIDDVFSGGNLEMGVYQFFVAYATANAFPLTSYFGNTQPVNIFTKNDVKEDTFTTDQAIRIKLDNISKDTVYRYYNIVVGETINQVTQYKLIATLPVEQNVYTYAGNSQASPISIDQVLQQYPFYHHSNSITKSNEYLFRANLEENPRLNLQRAANYIELQWQTVALKEGDYRKPEIAQRYRSFMRDEVYPISIIYEFEDGEDSVQCHIPGRSAKLSDLRPLIGKEVNDVSVDSDCNYEAPTAYWQTYNTASLIGKPHTAYNGCDEAIWEYGDMAYWESTEKYPNNKDVWGVLADRPIRHHKFPDSLITHIHNDQAPIENIPAGVSFDDLFTQKATIFPIGIKVNHRSVKKGIEEAIKEGVLTQAQASRIKSYRIVRGNRANNKSVIARGLIYDMWSYVKKGLTYYYPNYNYNDLRTDPLISRNDHYKGTTVPYLNTFDPTGRYTFHSPDTHFVEPPIGSILKLETLEFGRAKGKFAKSEDHAQYKLVSDKTYDTSVYFGAAIANFTDINDQTESEMTSLGSTVGGAVGTIAGGPVGAAIGSVAGGLLGGLFANNIGGPLGAVAQAMAKMALALYNTDKFLTFFKFLIPYRNYFYQYNSQANYNSFIPVANNGDKIRTITNYSYLPPEVTSITEDNKALFINNYNRESSVYVKVGSLLPSPSIEDTSRFIVSSKIGCTVEPDLSSVVSTVSSYYATLKNNRLNQYGNIYEVEYLETDSISYKLEDDKYKERTIFGGDIFINRFSLKRKMPFFIDNQFNLPNDTDFYLSDFANVGYPTYYMNTQGDDDFYLKDPLSFFRVETTSNTGIFRIPFITKDSVNVPNLAGNLALARRPKMRLDCNFVDDVSWIQRKGIVYLYYYGIPSFIVESDVNVDLREAKNNEEKDFYPRQQNLDYWLQEKNVRIREDNTYFYNKTFSKQNKERFIATNSALYDPNKTCTTTYPNRVIYSQQASVIDSFNSRDSWLIYKANNMYDFSKTNGKLIAVEGIENDKVMVRFEKTTQVFNAYVTIPTNTDNIQVDTGGMFQSKPQEYAHTDLGYIGSQHKDILHTEFGHIFVDAKRGQVFMLGSGGIDELSKDGMKNWFSKNLPFQLGKDIKDLPNSILDNSYYGLGLVLYYDRIYKRIFLTKLDYKTKEPINFDSEKGFYLESTKELVSLSDKRYFIPLHWTVSYNFYTKGWVSFHSFKPNYAIGLIDSFLTGVNNNTTLKGASTLWSHNVSNRSYQVYYGKKHPFIIETFTKLDGKQHIYSSVEYNADVYNYNTEQTKTRITALPFNKMIIYSDKGNSGLLEGNVVSSNDLYSALQYPKITGLSKQIQVVNKESNWRFNQFNNVLKNNMSPWIQTLDRKELNQAAINHTSSPVNNYPIRGEWARVQLINDNWTNYKIIMKWLVNHSSQSFS